VKGNKIASMLLKRNSYKYKLAALGDSMTLGFKNGGIYRTDLNFPNILARCFEPPIHFEQPSFTSQAGIPVNMEVLIRGLQEDIGNELTWDKYLSAGTHIYRTLRRIKSYWEGNKIDLCKNRPEPWHNQSVWGFAANDSWLMTEKKCRKFLAENEPRYTVFSVLPDNAMYITGRMILNPSFEPQFENNNMIDNISHLHENGGIENLILCIGHNNIVGGVTNLEIIYSTKNDLNAFYANRQCTVYRPEHFEMEMRTLYERIAKLKIPRVFVPTIPYLTIPPAIRGVNSDKTHSPGYFDYYTRFWIWDEDFDPEKHPYLSKSDAIELDQNVDQYNAIIRKLANEFGFHVVPVHKYVSAVARRRRGFEDIRAFPDSFLEAIKKNPKTSYLIGTDHDIRISTDYLRLCDETAKIERGGIFSLDGLHPTTVGYGLIANIYHMEMKKAGVKFQKEIDWDFVIENEPLIVDPPILLKDLRLLLRFLSLGRQERFTMFSKNLLQQLMEMFSFRKKEPESVI